MGKNSRRMPRLRKRRVYGSLTSISRLNKLTGNTGSFGGLPCRRMSNERSPPRYESRRTKKQ